MYAIVDIETTGGYADAHGITEIAIVRHDGERIVDTYETLINPGKPIPYFIQVLTGITNAMVETAPQFEEVAHDIFSRLNDAVFVAHNVNFDYSFVKNKLAQAGIDFQAKKLCTVRLARQIFPGLHSYGLGKLCRHLEITITNRHRAYGDAYATAQMFDMLLRHDTQDHITKALSPASKEQFIPPHLPVAQLRGLPASPGVYYFYNKQGKIIYVGKAKDLRKRVNSHFSNNSSTQQKQAFLLNIYNISYEMCGSEMMAILLESSEIKRLWPDYNRSQKNFEPAFGIYDYEDQNGFIRLGIDKLQKHVHPLAVFRLYNEALSYLHKLVREFELCPKLCGAQDSRQPCFSLEKEICRGACAGHEQMADYNARLQLCIDEMNEIKPSYCLHESGRSAEETACLLVENGMIYGMGYVTSNTTINDIEELKNCLKPLKENFYMRSVLDKYVEQHPEKIVLL